ncbi:hypothetical protein DFH06DRAFT_1117904 [Mycena polygramma]|nr:hypothetical protein DFH06DRAFT_1117904 [Mycena polygramma]
MSKASIHAATSAARLFTSSKRRGGSSSRPCNLTFNPVQPQYGFKPPSGAPYASRAQDDADFEADFPRRCSYKAIQTLLLLKTSPPNLLLHRLYTGLVLRNLQAESMQPFRLQPASSTYRKVYFNLIHHMVDTIGHPWRVGVEWESEIQIPRHQHHHRAGRVPESEDFCFWFDFLGSFNSVTDVLNFSSQRSRLTKSSPHPFGSVDFELAPISTFQREIITRITHPQTSSNLLQCIPTNPTSSYIKFIKRAMKFQPSGLSLLQFLRRTPIHHDHPAPIHFNIEQPNIHANLVAKRIKRAR